jgi:aspartate kinase
MTKDEALVSVLDVPDRPGVSLQVFARVAARNVTVDMIVQNVGEDGNADISFTVPRKELQITLEAVQEALAELKAGRVTHDDNVAKVSVVGLGMARQSGVAEKMFAALAQAGVNIQMISTSEIKISVLVDSAAAQTALRAVHRAFGLEQEPATRSPATRAAVPPARVDAADVASQLQGSELEGLAIDEISLDAGQSRVSILGVPDRPGIAARAFRDLAAAGVFVDMIVQSHSQHVDQASLSVTVPKEQMDTALVVARQLAQDLSCKGVSSCPDIAKLSVCGVGLRSQTGVAIRMFRALADAGVNLAMINTSEVRVNVVVDGRKGNRSLKALNDAFEDVLR